jgi:hypothetical protein
MKRDATADELRRQAEAARGLLDGLATDDDDLRHDMTEGETGLFEAIDAALSELDECDVTAEGCSAKIAQMEARKKRAEARRERVRALIEQAMLIADLPTVKRPTATLTVKDVRPKPIISDEALIPATFWRQPDPELDKKAINDAAKSGKKIPGVTMSNGGTSLQIRRQ